MKTSPTPTLERVRAPPRQYAQTRPPRRATEASISAFLMAYVEYEGRLREIGRLVNIERRHPRTQKEVKEHIQDLKLQQLETATRMRSLLTHFMGWR